MSHLPPPTHSFPFSLPCFSCSVPRHSTQSRLSCSLPLHHLPYRSTRLNSANPASNNVFLFHTSPLFVALLPPFLLASASSRIGHSSFRLSYFRGAAHGLGAWRAARPNHGRIDDEANQSNSWAVGNKLFLMRRPLVGRSARRVSNPLAGRR